MSEIIKHYKIRKWSSNVVSLKESTLLALQHQPVLVETLTQT